MSSPTTQEIEIIRLNRSLTNIRLQRYENALEDTKHVQSTAGRTEKRRFRMSQALYNLDRFLECREILETILNDNQSNNEALKELNRVKKRLSEREHGEYEFMAMRWAGEINPDCANYVGSVEIRVTESQGRGMFTTKAVKAGELLICEKAFCSSIDSDRTFSGPSNMKILINPNADRVMVGSQDSLVTQLVQKLQRNSSMISTIASLYHGSYISTEKTSVDDSPIIDT